MIDINDIEIVVAGKEHLKYIDEIIETMSDAAKVRGTGIAKRTHAYVEKVMLENKAVLALYHGRFAGFSYIESWSHKLFVTNSGLIVHPDFRGIGVASRIKRRVFALARERYPMAKVFSLTTGAAVLNMNTKLGFKPVTFEVLTRDKEFWKGCESCVNYDILQRNGGAKCLCTALLYDPAEHIGEPPVDYMAASSSTQPKRREKVVLAYSGGLDTSFAVKYLSEDCGYDVYTATANTGGFSAQELATIEKHALELGAVKHVNLDITQEYYNKSIKYMVYGNVLRNGTYPISVSSERMFQAIAIIKYAKKIGADCVAHGSTGAGNDQIRFDLTFQVLAPEIKVITPTRDLSLTRDYEINYLKDHGFVGDFKKLEYSYNEGLWGTSICGKETLHSDENLPESAFLRPMTAHDDKRLTLDFVKGELDAIDGRHYDDKVKAIQDLEDLVAPYGIGRDINLGDTIIGIKGRVGFEAAAPLLIIAAHKLLEKYTLTKWQQYWKEQLGNWYGMFFHESYYLEPVMRDIEAYLTKSQRNVTGKVIIDLKPYRYDLVGVQSPFDLSKTGFGEYGEMNKAWTADDVKGYTKIYANPLKIYHYNQLKNGIADDDDL